MVSLCILAGTLLLTIVLTVLLLMIGTRLARVPRVPLRKLLLIALSLLLTSALFAIVQDSFFKESLIATGLNTLAGWVAFFVIVGLSFELSFRRTLIPWAVYAFGSIAAGLPLAFFVSFYLTSAYRMPTESMSPTLPVNSKFMVAKIIHPKRWDVVAYDAEESGRHIAFVKRLIGLPGDRLRFEKSQLYINDQLATLPEAIRKPLLLTPWSGPTSAHYREGETIQLGPDEYFFVGDNANNSLDSRMRGPSKQSSIIGVVDLIYSPLTELRILK